MDSLDRARLLRESAAHIRQAGWVAGGAEAHYIEQLLFGPPELGKQRAPDEMIAALIEERARSLEQANMDERNASGMCCAVCATSIKRSTASASMERAGMELCEACEAAGWRHEQQAGKRRR